MMFWMYCTHGPRILTSAGRQAYRCTVHTHLNMCITWLAHFKWPLGLHLQTRNIWSDRKEGIERGNI